MRPQSSSGAAELERLTSLAKDAAEQGRWDIVGERYRERAMVFEGVSLSPQEAAQLLTIDQEIRERTLVAKAALGQLLREAAAIRRRLKDLRHGVAVQFANSGKLLLEG